MINKYVKDGIMVVGSRLILGVLFIYASIDKIIQPADFAEAVYNYQILPGFLINLTAVILPWLELILGLLLIIGLFQEGSVLIVTGLLVVFLGAMIFNLARGLGVYCGCFSATMDGTDNAPMAWYVFRDGLFLLPAFYLFHHAFLGKKRTAKVYDQ